LPSSPHMSATALLASVADMQITLNDSFRVAEVASGSGSLRQLPRDAIIGRPWLELVRECDAATAEAALTAALTAKVEARGRQSPQESCKRG